VRIAKPSAPAFGRQPTGTVGRKILQKFSRGAVKDLGTNRYSYNSILTFATRAIRSLTVPSAIGNVQRVIAKMEQGVQRTVRYDPNIASASAVTSRGPAARDKLLATKSSYTISPMATLHSNPGAINKHINRKRRRALSL
jgi:hypothetical protein